MRPVSVLVTALLMCLGAVAPASAETVRGRDARHDVTFYPAPPQGEATMGTMPGADLVGYRFTYTPRKITAVLNYADLRPRRQYFYSAMVMSWSKGSGQVGYAELEVETTGANRAGTSTLNLVSGGPDCRRVSHRIDYQRNTVTLSMPASCIEAPRRMRAYAGTYLADREDNPTYSYVDTAPNNPRGGPGVTLRRG